MKGEIIKYDILIPPIEKPACEFTHSETVSYFNWFISKIPERVYYLSSVISNELCIPRQEFNLSPESLKYIWAWFLQIVEIEQIPKMKGAKSRHNDTENSFSAFISNQAEKRLSLLTEYILRDIGMYLGQVFIENVEGIRWTYYEKPREDFFVNTPVLAGFYDKRFSPPFKMYFEPIHMAGVQAAKAIDNEQQIEDLYNIYCKWANTYTPY